MKKAAAILGYVAAVIGAGMSLGASMEVATVVLVSFLFVLAFGLWASGSPTWGVSVVVLVTIVTPVAGLLFIGSPVYASWAETLGVIVRASREHGVLQGVEWLMPLIGALAGQVVVGRVRSNKPLQTTREDARV